MNPSRQKMLVVFGTRPEAIKMAPVVRECKRRSSEVETIVCLTGQHREMLQQVTDYFGIEADVDLELMQQVETYNEVDCHVIAEILTWLRANR